MFASHIIWLLRTREIRKEAASAGKTFDDIAAEHEESGTPFRFAERKSRKARKGRKGREQREKDAELGAAPEPAGGTMGTTDSDAEQKGPSGTGT